ncbi:putative nucleotidyltransferase substrate binding domain-containing protein [Rheinheimera texasensis]|uniref:putative nucleotidyltransferase substrate binding domain-containing protein n=1 Tax=Rheinheimera texasensis TaxID=306205 RepID=UPI0032B14349
MQIQDVVQFLTQVPPFADLPAADLTALSQQITVYYAVQSEQLPFTNQLVLVRTGLFLMQQQQQLYPLQSGDCWGYRQLLAQQDQNEQLHCQEDGLVYLIPQPVFVQYQQQFKNFALYFQRLLGRSLHLHQQSATDNRRVGDLCALQVISIQSQATIQQAAQLMTQQRISSLLVIDEQQLTGILTDRDLRSKVLAQGKSALTPVAEVMTRNPYRIHADAFAFEALQLMSQHNIHHLPVERSGVVSGVLTTSDLVRSTQEHPLFLISHIHRQHDSAGLSACAQAIHELSRQLGQQQLPSTEISQILSTLYDALAQSWLKLAQQHLGPAPCAFSWLCFGSQARQDMLLSADQDNALLLEKEPVGDIGRYFSALARFVCDGLASSGQILCPGNVMATNEKLCLSLAGWSARFAGMIQTPTPQALLDSTIYFDARVVAGSQALFNALQSDILNASHQQLFIWQLAKNALAHQPPLGFFKHFILEQDGAKRRGLDLKKRGIALIHDLVRVHALAHGIHAVNTPARLSALVSQQVLTDCQARDLTAAFALLHQLRWQLQYAALAQGGSFSNLQDPAELNVLQRHQLKDAFAVISQHQQIVAQRYCREL